jgi:hypothetical protein
MIVRPISADDGFAQVHPCIDQWPSCTHEGSVVSIRCSRFFRPFLTHGLRGADAGMGVCLKCHGMAKDALSDFP